MSDEGVPEMETSIAHGTTRTDALRPSVFDPADFEVFSYVDLEEFRDGGFAGHIREWERDLVDTFGAARTAKTLGYFSYLDTFPTEAELAEVNPLNICDHCGAHGLRYIAAVRQISTGNVFVFGSSCVARAELRDRAEFKLVSLKKLAADRRQRAELAHKQAIFLNENPDIREFILAIPHGEQGEPKHSFDFINSMDLALNKYGSLTDNQAAALRKVIAKQPERERIERERAERDANKGPAPEGRQTVRGEIVSVKARDGYMPGSVEYKMVVRLENDSAVWVTIPRRLEEAFQIELQKQNDADTKTITEWQKSVTELYHSKYSVDDLKPSWSGQILSEMIKVLGDEVPPVPERKPQPTLADFFVGRKVELTATFEVSDRDPHFAFGKRPTVKFLEEASN